MTALSMFQGSFKKTLWVQENFVGNQRMFQACFKEVSGLC